LRQQITKSVAHPSDEIGTIAKGNIHRHRRRRQSSLLKRPIQSHPNFRICPGASISPDGRWLAYTSRNSGLPQIFVRPLGADGKPRGGLWQISASGGRQPLWSRAGRQLLFLSLDNHVMAVEYSVSADSFQALKPRSWTETPIGTVNIGNAPFDAYSYDLTGDGKHIITWDRMKCVTAPRPTCKSLCGRTGSARWSGGSRTEGVEALRLLLLCLLGLGQSKLSR
jgi:hypothetical protein